jgi:hypothetical protein
VREEPLEAQAEDPARYPRVGRVPGELPGRPPAAPWLQSTLGVNPHGAASAADDVGVSLDLEADLPGVAAAAGGPFAVTAMHQGRSAVVAVHLPPVQSGHAGVTPG